jgi:DNA-directed RNA polymerase specialized sigma subunit
MSETDLYELVQKAQAGDKDALAAILERFYPAIKQMSKKRKKQEQEDVEQANLELVLKIILTYDLSKTPDFSQFCNKIQSKLQV